LASFKTIVQSLLLTVLSFGASISSLAAQSLLPETLLNPPADSWPTFNGDYSGRRFSKLAQIDSSNVGSITPAWIYRAHSVGIKSSPLLVNGILYVTTPDNVWAIDAGFGHEIWHYQRPFAG
jgi:alcohol dehydrogenase (cytochrome c)